MVSVVRYLPYLTCRFLVGRTTNFHIILSHRISVPAFIFARQPGQLETGMDFSKPARTELILYP